jgi:hypothetical protein
MLIPDPGLDEHASHTPGFRSHADSLSRLFFARMAAYSRSITSICGDCIDSSTIKIAGRIPVFDPE